MADGRTLRVLTDQVGSVRRIIDASTGATVQETRYSPYGIVEFHSASIDQPFGYAGGLWDSLTGLVRFGARDYDPEIGRWTAKDPILTDGGVNLYEYAAGAPQTRFDANGLETVVYVWDSSFHSAASLGGHVSIEVNGVAFSWEGNGLNIDNAIDYIEENIDSRNGRGRGADFYQLNLDFEQEMNLVLYLYERNRLNSLREEAYPECGNSQVFADQKCAGYNLTGSNCGQVVLGAIGAATGRSFGDGWFTPLTAGHILARTNLVRARGRVDAGDIGPSVANETVPEMLFLFLGW